MSLGLLTKIVEVADRETSGKSLSQVSAIVELCNPAKARIFFPLNSLTSCNRDNVPSECVQVTRHAQFYSTYWAIRSAELANKVAKGICEVKEST
jgi:hypothetical protein